MQIRGYIQSTLYRGWHVCVRVLCMWVSEWVKIQIKNTHGDLLSYYVLWVFKGITTTERYEFGRCQLFAKEPADSSLIGGDQKRGQREGEIRAGHKCSSGCDHSARGPEYDGQEIRKERERRYGVRYSGKLWDIGDCVIGQRLKLEHELFMASNTDRVLCTMYKSTVVQCLCAP